MTMPSPLDLPQPRSSTQVLAEFDDQFDQALADWFARHRGGWSGTASELIAAVKSSADAGNDLWPDPARALYAHLESRRPALYSLGVDVLPHAGFPRMVSLRPCQEEKPGRKPPSNTPAINRTSDPPNNSHPSADQKTIHAVTDSVSPAHESVPIPAIDLVGSFVPERIASEEHTDRGNRAFENTAEALFSIVEMRERIEEQGLDLKSTIDLVASRTQAITGSSGVVVGWLQQGTLVYPVQVGIAAAMAGLPSQTKLLRSCISKGTVLQLSDAQKDPGVGATCRRESVRSLIVAPIFHNRNVAGVMELLFKDMRSFSNGDVMTLELTADLLSERAAGAAQKQAKQPTAQESTSTRLRITESIEPQADRAAALVSAPISRRRVWILP
jgi:hypothetical protein